MLQRLLQQADRALELPLASMDKPEELECRRMGGMGAQQDRALFGRLGQTPALVQFGCLLKQTRYARGCGGAGDTVGLG